MLFYYIYMANEMYQETWFGDSNENGFGSIYDNINNKQKWLVIKIQVENHKAKILK